MTIIKCESNPELERFFPGDSEMARRMRAFDWSKSDIGSPETWPQNLCIAIGICLTSRFPMHVWWGPSLTLFYNDAYISFLGRVKHPGVLGRSGQEAWPELWDTIGPMIREVFTDGNASWSEDILMFFDRELPKEEVYVTFSFSPVFGESNKVEGMFCACTETTEKIIGNRRLDTLRKLGIQTTEARTEIEACIAGMGVVGENPYDIPFAAIYLVNEFAEKAYLVTSSGFTENGHQLPQSVSFAGEEEDHLSPWPLATVLRTKKPIKITVLDALDIKQLGKPWPDPVRQAIIFPIHSAGHEKLAGLLIVGVSPRLPLNEAYHTFFSLVAGHIANAIADARSYEEERKRAEALLELDRAKTTFFSNVSHEFRTPLTLMLGPMEELLIRDGAGLPAEEREQVSLAHRNGLRLLKLVNTLLDFSRIEAGRIQASYEPTDLANYTVELASVFRSAIEKAGLHLNVDCAPLPEPVYVDRDMWEKIVLNLLSNAFKFTFEGEITVSLRWRGDHAELIVGDTGVGIPENELPRLFQRFHRVEGTKGRTYEGTGIGLALVQELVKLHGGTIGVQSQSGSGSRFTISIPAGSKHLPQDRINAKSTLSSTATGASPFIEEALRWLPDETVDNDDFKPWQESDETFDGYHHETGRPCERILVVDDNADMRSYLHRILSGRWTVELASDGPSALQAIQNNLPDMVLADIMMPGMNGIELLRRIRGNPVVSGIPVILLSARAGEESRVEGMEHGADDYLVKPFNARELLARVAAHLDMARMRRESSEQIRQSEQRLSILVTASSDVVYRMSPDWGEMRYLQGKNFIPDTDSPNSSWLDKYIHPDDQPYVLSVINEAIRTKNVFELEYRILQVDGSLGWTFSRAVPMLDAKGEIEEWIGTASDITERKRAEEALRESEERQSFLLRFSDILRAMSDEQSIMDLTVKMLAKHLCLDRCYISEVFIQQGFSTVGPEKIRPDLPPMSGVYKLSEYPETMRQLMTQPMFIPNVAEDPRFSENERNLLAGLHLRALLVVALRKGQSEVVWALAAAMATPRTWTESERILLEEVAERTWEAVKRAKVEEALRESEKKANALVRELEEADRNKNQFISVLSHELRNPLAAISAGVQILEVTQDVNQAGKAKEIMKRQSNQLCKLVDDLLELTRISQNKIKLKKEYINLNDILKSAMEDIRPEYDKKGVKLGTRIQTRTILINADPIRITQAIGNILFNALKFTQTNGTVWMTLKMEKDNAVISVIDNGIGISPDILTHLFTPFTQAENTLDRGHGGLGLGLSIVKGIVELHGGSVTASSDGLGKGSTFTIRLPITTEDNNLRMEKPISDKEGKKRLKLLVIEDNRDFADLLSTMLSTLDYVVNIAYDGLEGLKLAKQIKPDIIFCDIGLPGLNGFEVAESISKDNDLKDIKLIALTGYAGKGEVERILQAGFYKHLAKPIDFATLKKVLG